MSLSDFSDLPLWYTLDWVVDYHDRGDLTYNIVWFGCMGSISSSTTAACLPIFLPFAPVCGALAGYSVMGFCAEMALGASNWHHNATEWLVKANDPSLAKDKEMIVKSFIA